MDKDKIQIANRTLHQSAMPERVLLICDGLLKINADFFATHLHKLLDEFESILFNNAESHKIEVQQGGQFSQLRNLKRTRYDFIPSFLANVEHHIASIRPQTITKTSDDSENQKITPPDFQLLETNISDEQQIRLEITSRCESQNSFELFLLCQRFGVLAGQPAFEQDKLPLGPKVFCLCLQESVESLDLEGNDKKIVLQLFERFVLSNYAVLLRLCNQFLVENGVLPNLSYIPLRNPELRKKKSPISMQIGQKNTATDYETDDDKNHSNVQAINFMRSATVNDTENIDPETIEESFTNLRQLLSKRKQLINKLSAFTNSYESANANVRSKLAEVPAETLNTILSEFQTSAANNPSTRVSIQHLKHDLLVQLRNKSTESIEMTLKEEDSDAIDLVGMLMENALKDVNPNSSASQLLSLMQTPLIRVVMQDKSFFSNHIHPARQMLNILAETGFNWLDEHNKDETLNGKITGIVSKTVREFKGDNQELVGAYEQTNQILQSLIKKANTAERRQIDAISGKERLIAARSRAEFTIADLIINNDIPISTVHLLKNAWADVMALTELRQGSHSSDWLEQKRIAEFIIAANRTHATQLDKMVLDDIKTKIQEMLALIGYDSIEASNIADCLLNKSPDSSLSPSLTHTQHIRFGAETQSANQHDYHLTPDQIHCVEQIKKMPIGTWFEFTTKNSGIIERRKLAWRSELTNNILFVNQRGQKTAEMMIEELAIEISEGTAKIQAENKRSIFIVAFKNLLGSLKDLMPGKSDGRNE